MRKLIHPLLIKLMKAQRKHELHIVTSEPLHNGNVIYAVNHSCRYDVPIVGEMVRNHTYILVGKQSLFLIDRICFWLNGVIWVDRPDRKSKQKAFKKMVALLERGENICMYPEGTWNLTPSKPMLPLYWGIINLAKETGTPIQPLVLEYIGNDCYVNFGNSFFVGDEDTREEKILELTDVFAALKWEVWEKFPVQHREECMKTEWAEEAARRIAEYPKLNIEYEKKCELK